MRPPTTLALGLSLRQRFPAAMVWIVERPNCIIVLQLFRRFEESKRMALALASGTCRVFEPTKLIRAAGGRASLSRHRVHTTREILSLLAAIKAPGRDAYDHLLSDRAFNEIVVKGSDVVAGHRLRLRNVLWQRADRLLIEICSMRSFTAEGGSAVIGPLVLRDMGKQSDALQRAIGAGRVAPLRADDFQPSTMSRSELIADMRRIKEEAEGRTIVWVCHAIPSDPSPEYDHVRAIRSKLAEDVRAGAELLGDRFFDPSTVVAGLGQSRAFKQRGRDTAHFSARGLSALAAKYARLLELKTRLPLVDRLA